MIVATVLSALVAAVVISGLFVGLVLALAIGVKHRRDYAAELRHYEDQKRPRPS